MRLNLQQQMKSFHLCFNTASGMRSHATKLHVSMYHKVNGFQYRKRYEVTCDKDELVRYSEEADKFQYRKRYEVTCDR